MTVAIRIGNTRFPLHISEGFWLLLHFSLRSPRANPTSWRISKLYAIADSSLTYLSSLTEEAETLEPIAAESLPLKPPPFCIVQDRLWPRHPAEIRWLNTSYPVQALLIWSDLLFPLTTRLRYKDLLSRMTATTLLCSRSHPHQSMLM